MVGSVWALLKDTLYGFMEHDALSRGAAMAYYTIFSLAPVLIIVIAIAGFAFGYEAAQGAIVDELSGMMGRQSAEALQAMIKSAGNRHAGVIATIIGITTLVLAASGVFGEMQAALNTIWKADLSGSSISRLIRARLVSLGLVAALGFLLLVSLVLSAAVTALGQYLDIIFPAAHLVLQILNFVVSFLLISLLFAAIYKVLPDKDIAWRDVGIGAVATAFLFTVGKSLIGLYIGSSSVASSYGAAGALVVILVWIYYSAQIFLLGAEFTRAYAETHGTHAEAAAAASAAPAQPATVPPHRAPLPNDPELLRRQAAETRRQLDETLSALAGRVPGTSWIVPTIRPEAGGPASEGGQSAAQSGAARKPSALLIAAAGIAGLVLMPRAARREREKAKEDRDRTGPGSPPR